MSERTFECPDDKRGGGRYDGDLGLTVLDGELHGDAQTLPRGCRFRNIFTDLLGRLGKGSKIKQRYALETTGYTYKAKRTDLRCRRG